jgi:hypothetical protein
MLSSRASSPEVHQRKQVPLRGRGEGGGGLVAGEEALGEERLHLPDEYGARELSCEHRGDADGYGCGDALGFEPAQHFDQREVGVERGLTEPVAAMRPAAMVQHVGQVAVQGEYEVHRKPPYRMAA